MSYQSQSLRTLTALCCLAVLGAVGMSACSKEQAGTAKADKAAKTPSPQAAKAKTVAVEATAKPNCQAAQGDFPQLRLVPYVKGLRRPVYLAGVPGDDSRVFVLEQPGRVRVVVDGELQAEPFLDLTKKVNSDGNEQGLLGLAFHPQYAKNGLLYLHYTSGDQTIGGKAVASGTGITVEFSVDPSNRSRGKVGSERLVLATPQPEGNHNGGNIQFGPDGFLYLGFGDGGAANDRHGPMGNGQALDTHLGKILRIDVTGRSMGNAYSVPPGNMSTTNAKALPEIWSYGWRNPWRFSFDACGGDLYVGDVGQNLVEEIDFEPAGTASGRNYGWRLMEAERCFNPDSGCDAAKQKLQLPIASYGRKKGISITGGYVYRGGAVAGLRGTYLYADFQSARFFSLKMVDGKPTQAQEITENLNRTDVAQIASFGQDNAGELYVVSLEGGIYRIAAQ